MLLQQLLILMYSQSLGHCLNHPLYIQQPRTQVLRAEARVAVLVPQASSRLNTQEHNLVFQG